jgi:hypothetical protein
MTGPPVALSGERRLPACRSRQLAAIRVIRCSFGAVRRKDVAGRAAGNYRLAACAPRN